MRISSPIRLFCAGEAAMTFLLVSSLISPSISHMPRPTDECSGSNSTPGPTSAPQFLNWAPLSCREILRDHGLHWLLPFSLSSRPSSPLTNAKVCWTSIRNSAFKRSENSQVKALYP